MLKSNPFTVILKHTPVITLPIEPIKRFIDTNQKRVRVIVTANNKQIEFYAALKANASGGYHIYLSKSKQKELKLVMLDEFTLQLLEDKSKYGVEMSEELEAVLLSDFDAYQIFESLTPGKQRTIIYAISRYKSSQMRIDKSLILCENLIRGITDQKHWLKKN